MPGKSTDSSILNQVRLDRSEWKRRAADHEIRIDGLIGDYMERRRNNQKHPVIDFLFEYYSFRASKLRLWSPGAGILLENAGPDEPFDHAAFSRAGEKAFIDPESIPHNRLRALMFISELLHATVNRSPRFSCYGLHEWAMVYRAGERRHQKWPLRMAQKDLDRFVETSTITCSHFDAFRFFTDEARPLNRFQPTRETMTGNEQPGCLHTNMDLYKWAYKLFPWASSDLIADAFELALFARDVDMRASPYDLNDLGYTPITIETDAGRRQYIELQLKIHQKSIPVRTALLECINKLRSVNSGRIGG
ncbi:MAG: 3-methyladenine DNA glycosylase [Cyclonatronaceae bacterium]